MKYEVIWDVEDDVFGGVYSLRHECETREEAEAFVRGLRNDPLTGNYEIFDPECEW